jgi:hypothetical protein
MDQSRGRDETAVEVRPMPSEHEGKSCADCRHIKPSYFGWCRYFDKPTSGEINGCFGFEQRKR